MKTARNEKELEKIRERIIDGALNIIVEKGLSGLTMRQLASRIGMTAPNIYNYFPNKDALYLSIVIRGFEMLRKDLKRAYRCSSAPEKRVRAMIDAYMAFGIRHPRYYDIMFSRTTPRHNDYVGTPFEKLSEIEYRISMDIAELANKAAGELMGANATDEDLRLRVIQIWSLLHGMIGLRNSDVVTYVAENPGRIYSQLIDEFIVIVRNSTI